MSRKEILDRLFEAAKRLRSAKGGNVAIIFAVAMVPMVMATLGIVQYEMAISTRTKLNAVADAAALQAVSKPAVVAYVTSATTGQTNATNMFNAQAAQVQGVTITQLNVSVTSTAATSTAPGSLTATVTYVATLGSLAPGIFGSYFTSVTGTSAATTTLPAYVNFYLLLDNSPSMGIGASAADISTIAGVNGGCGFECHSPDALHNAGYPGYVNNGTIPGASTRLDALKTAAQTIISQAQSNQTIPGQYSFGVYTFHNTVTAVISPPNSNYSTVSSAVSGIQLPTTDQTTQIADAVDWLTRHAVTSGSGNGTAASPYQFVFLVTDGAEDHYNFGSNYTGGNYETLTAPTGSFGLCIPCASVMAWQTVCPNLKNKGATLGVIYTTYDNVGGTQYADMVAPFVGNIAGALQSCASSPSYFLQADDGSSINAAMQLLFQTALQQTAHLSQ